MKTYLSHSPEETEALGESLGKHLKGGEVIAYRGGLGLGKTCFTRGLARGLGFTGNVTSPTFALVQEYIGGRLPLYHFDLYRVTGIDDLDSTGFFEYLDAGGVLAIEWSENFTPALPEDTIFVSFERLTDTDREITVESECEKEWNL